jgi:signal transduction histidine kinase
MDMRGVKLEAQSSRTMSETAVRVLLIEDDEDDYILTRGLLAEIPQYSFELEWIRDYDQALPALTDGQYDVALVDYRLGSRDGVQLIRQARASGCRQPIILLTGQTEREIDLAATQAGASDFLSKSEVTSLALERAVRYNMQNAKLEEQRVRLLAERAARAEAEAGSRAKDQFLATLSHELRTPLTPVLMAISSLTGDASLPPTVRDDLSMIRRNVELEARLIDDLLDLTRIARGTLELQKTTVDLHAKLDNVLAICRPDIDVKQIQIILKKQATRDRVHGDSARIGQILWNVLKNAVKFTPNGGRIEISTTSQADDFVFTMTDTGVGIDHDLLPRIFDAFEKGGRRAATHSKGTTGGLGLGLTISKALADLHHGELTAASEGPGKGATFVLRLPLMKLASPPPPVPAPAAPGPQYRILFVEDHADTAMALARVLSRQGYAVHRADSVAAAKKLIDTESFDLLISDIGLPDGSGLEIMKHLRQKQSTPGIAVSGYGMEEDITSAKTAGFAEHLTKPVHPDRLLSTVAEMVKKPAGK